MSSVLFSFSCLEEFFFMAYILKVSNMVEGLEQELADITDSGDFAAYQVSIL